MNKTKNPLIVIPTNLIPEDWGITHILFRADPEVCATICRTMDVAAQFFATFPDADSEMSVSPADALEVSGREFLSGILSPAILPADISGDGRITPTTILYAPADVKIPSKRGVLAPESYAVKIFRAGQVRFFGYTSEDLGWFLTEPLFRADLETLAKGDIPENFATLH